MSTDNTTKYGDVIITYPDSYIDKLYTEIMNVIEKNNIEITDIVGVTINMMKIVDKYKNINGVQKKNLILHILGKLIDDKIEDEQLVNNLKFIINMTMPFVIDTFISIDKRELIIKMKKRCSKYKCCV